MSKKFLTPVVPPSLGSDPAGAVSGAIYFNSGLNSLRYYDGSAWITIGAATEGAVANSVQIINSYSNSPQNGTIAYNTATNRFVIAYNGIWNEVAYKSETDSPIDGGNSLTESFDIYIDGGGSSETTFVNAYYNV
jgi:hypothetical protein